MSLPRINKNKSRTRSRSPVSGTSRPRVDQFGRSLPARSSSRSRSRSNSSGDRSRSGDSPHSRKSHGSQRKSSNHGRKDGRGGRFRKDRHSGKRHGSSSSSDSSSSSGSNSDSNNSRIVASTKPKYLNARVFVANIIAKEVTKEELIKQFEKYGPVIDVLVHTRNYAFIQFTKEEHAHLAVEGENGSTLKGWRLDVKMANENRKGGSYSKKPDGPRDDRRGKMGRGGGNFNIAERHRSPQRDGPMWDPYLDPFYSGRSRPPVPYPVVGIRDPYFLDPYAHRRGLPDLWLGDDPYRPGLFPDPYRDVQRPAPPPAVIECAVFVTSAQLLAYGQAVERRVKEHNIITAVSVMTEGRTAVQLVEELTAQAGLFAIFINPQNEMHRSLTLNILHGLPQEHRNMPLDDAISLVGKSFLKYVEELREKAHAAATPLPSSSAPINSRIFLPASKEVSYLLNLLADSRALTVAELNSVIIYLQERRDKLIDAESRPLVTEVLAPADSFHKSPPSHHGDPPQPTRKETVVAKAEEATSASIHEDLTNKILSLFGSSGKYQGVPPADQASQSKLPTGTPAPAALPQVTAPSSASLINFDNPNVQKALDNLFHNTPSILKNMNTKSSSSTAQSGDPYSALSGGTMSNSGVYGQTDNMIASYNTQGQPSNQGMDMHQGNYDFTGQMMHGAGQASQPISKGLLPTPVLGYSVPGGQQGQMGRMYPPPEY